jgi:hypothetical protein
LFNISGEFRREKKKTIVECFLVEWNLYDFLQATFISHNQI